MELGLALRSCPAPPPCSARERACVAALFFSPSYTSSSSSRSCHRERSFHSCLASLSALRPPVSRLAISLELGKRDSLTDGGDGVENDEEELLLPSASFLSLSEKPDRNLALLDDYELEELDAEHSTCPNHRSGQLLSLPLFSLLCSNCNSLCCM